MTNAEKWTSHSPMSDPAEHLLGVADLPSDLSVLNRIVQGVLIHFAWLSEYGLDETSFRVASRQTLPVADRLTDIFVNDLRPLSILRPPEQRAVGTCRDFALMLVSILRTQGVPSRLRCGFASYLTAGWEDHWVCEYWDSSTRAWRLSDAQIDPTMRQKCRVAFDPTNVPRDSFLTAGQAWRQCRAGRSDPNQFGQGDAAGLWFLRINVIRDHYAVNNVETSIWDTWRSAPAATRAARDLARVDALAANPEQALIEATPDWVT